MSLEGRIRDLGLHEVAQLLSHSRKSGVLAAWSLVDEQAAWMRVQDGAIIDAGAGAPPPDHALTDAAIAADRDTVVQYVQDLLAWRDGRFAFTASHRTVSSPVRVHTDAMLVEAARRAHGWSELVDRIPSPRVVPTFVDASPAPLPLLHLAPQEWEVLTGVDGQRDLVALASTLGRDLLEVATIVHRLVGAGLLAVRERGVAAVQPMPAGVQTRFTPIDSLPVDAEGLEDASDWWQPEASSVTVPASGHVALLPSEPSAHGEDGRALGDAAARVGDFAEALMQWEGYVATHAAADDVPQVREAIALVRRLSALLDHATAVGGRDERPY